MVLRAAYFTLTTASGQRLQDHVHFGGSVVEPRLRLFTSLPPVPKNGEDREVKLPGPTAGASTGTTRGRYAAAAAIDTLAMMFYDKLRFIGFCSEFLNDGMIVL